MKEHKKIFQNSTTGGRHHRRTVGSRRQVHMNEHRAIGKLSASARGSMQEIFQVYDLGLFV